MVNQQASFVHRGNTFFGTVDLLGHDADQAVRVRYNGAERVARLEGFPPDVVAHLLLRDLVLQEFAVVRPRTRGWSS